MAPEEESENGDEDGDDGMGMTMYQQQPLPPQRSPQRQQPPDALRVNNRHTGGGNINRARHPSAKQLRAIPGVRAQVPPPRRRSPPHPPQNQSYDGSGSDNNSSNGSGSGDDDDNFSIPSNSERHIRPRMRKRDVPRRSGGDDDQTDPNSISAEAKRAFRQKLIDEIEMIRKGPYGPLIPATVSTIGPNTNYAQLTSEYNRVRQFAEAAKYANVSTTLLLNGAKLAPQIGILSKKQTGYSFGLDMLKNWDLQLSPNRPVIESAFQSMFDEDGPLFTISGKTNLMLILLTSAFATYQMNSMAQTDSSNSSANTQQQPSSYTSPPPQTLGTQQPQQPQQPQPLSQVPTSAISPVPINGVSNIYGRVPTNGGGNYMPPPPPSPMGMRTPPVPLFYPPSAAAGNAALTRASGSGGQQNSSLSAMTLGALSQLGNTDPQGNGTDLPLEIHSQRRIDQVIPRDVVPRDPMSALRQVENMDVSADDSISVSGVSDAMNITADQIRIS